MKKPQKNVKSLLAIGAFLGVINYQTISEAMVRSILGVEPTVYMETIDNQRENYSLSATNAIRPVVYDGDDHSHEGSTDLDAEQAGEYITDTGQERESEVRIVNDADVYAGDDAVADAPDSNETPEPVLPEEPETPQVPDAQIPEVVDPQPQPSEEALPESDDRESGNDINSNNNQNNNKKEPVLNDPDPITENPESPIDEEERENNFQFSVSQNLTTRQFINEIGTDAQDVAYQNDLYASVMIAQAILETGSGNSALSSPPNHNLFGIKGSYRGQKVTFNTQEDDGSGTWYTISSHFRKYPGYRESIEDYARLLRGGLSGNPRFYAPVWKSNASTYREATAWLTGRYATDIHYDQKLNALIEAYDLTIYDHEPTEDTAEQDAQVRSKNVADDSEEFNEKRSTLFEELQVPSVNRRGSGNLPASIRTAKERLQENANANTFANQLRGKERATSEVKADE